MAIRWHIGFSEAKENYNAVGQAMEKYPVVLALHEADLEATKILEIESWQAKNVNCEFQDGWGIANLTNYEFWGGFAENKGYFMWYLNYKLVLNPNFAL